MFFHGPLLQSKYIDITDMHADMNNDYRLDMKRTMSC